MPVTTIPYHNNSTENDVCIAYFHKGGPSRIAIINGTFDMTIDINTTLFVACTIGNTTVTASCDCPHEQVYIYIIFTNGKYLTLLVNGNQKSMVPIDSIAEFQGMFNITTDSHFNNNDFFIGGVPPYRERCLMTRTINEKYRATIERYPIFQYGNPLIKIPNMSARDPSEIILVDGRYYVYFTKALIDGFRGSIYLSSCAQDDDVTCANRWSNPVEVIPHSCDAASDYDGSGCFTPDCFFDGKTISLFYTGLNSTHEKGFPQWGVTKEPESIMVAHAHRPGGDFIKTQVSTLLTESRLRPDEATVPGGYELKADGTSAYDVSLIDHGQCWIMPDGEKRYYYKGGGGVGARFGAVCLMRHLDNHWLNGTRYMGNPILNEASHMEGILITKNDDELYLQLQIFGEGIARMVTYASDCTDGIQWTRIGTPYTVDAGVTSYPLSIGVYDTSYPKWAIGQFPNPDGTIYLAFMKCI
ncbi:MAG: hypothetical protein AABZ39_15045 [Spirochaetota bacterium]